MVGIKKSSLPFSGIENARGKETYPESVPKRVFWCVGFNYQSECPLIAFSNSGIEKIRVFLLLFFGKER